MSIGICYQSILLFWRPFDHPVPGSYFRKMTQIILYVSKSTMHFNVKQTKTEKSFFFLLN